MGVQDISEMIVELIRKPKEIVSNFDEFKMSFNIKQNRKHLFFFICARTTYFKN